MPTSNAGIMARLSLALILMASISAASPSIQTVTSGTFYEVLNVALFTPQTILLTTQVPYQGGYLNTVQALNSTLFTQVWSFQSFGEVALTTTAFAFPAIPKLVFLVVNNLQPPNVTAVEPLTGVAAWSAPASFPTASVINLLASVDGRTLYLLTTNLNGQTQLTAFDAGTGNVLFGKNVGSSVVVTQCGKGGASCIASEGSAGNVTFLDGRNGSVVGRVPLPSFSAAGTMQSITGDQLLFSPPLSNALTVINTATFTVMWSLQQLPSYTVISSAPYTGAKNSKHTAVVLISSSGLLGYDSRTGKLLWNSTATTVCPFSAPAPSKASGFYLEDGYVPQYSLGAMPRGLQSGNLFSFVATCVYSDSYLTIAGAMSAVDGTTKWWRYISGYPNAYPITPVGDDYFVLLSPLSGSADLYDSHWKIFGTFAGGQSLYVIQELAVVDGIVFASSSYEYNRGQNYLSVITITP